ncbi:hypothetical protein E1A91_A07G244000v1 [Gossypium mustelinum]|uniref:Uncharacterized protein n=1 Tax=Gossypium mustelinum TaxID=34275 RepID=A0A5D2YP55_GOSMU|nr:hypothetical protein E1A91_A07G244000v1 [Gossypium mustelinum]
MYKDMEYFLFKMLGEEFRLESDAIQEVLNRCGCNIQKSMKKLLDRSMFTLYVNFSLPCFDVYLHMKMKMKKKIVSNFFKEP